MVFCENIKSLLFILTISLISKHAIATNIDALRENAESGDANSQFKLAILYDFGREIERDLEKAAEWYRKAAEQNHTEAQNSLGSLYQAGEGVDQDFKQAMIWYKKSAAHENPEAYNNIAYLHDLGLGVQEDDTKAIEYYEKAARKGSIKAFLNLGLEHGKRENYVESIKWLDLARLFTQSSNNMKLKWRIRGMLDEVKSRTSEDEIKQGQLLANEWYEKHIPK